MKRLRSVILLGCLCSWADAAPVNVIFDTDMASDCDDAGALQKVIGALMAASPGKLRPRGNRP